MPNEKNESSPISNLKSLQILRAIAATTVVYYHIGAIPHFGSFGVDIFFVISGFVMAMVIANGQDTYQFAVSRLARIVPLYWILTTCLLVVAAVKPSLLNSTTANFENYLKSIFFIPYFKENGALNPMLAVGWTLNYEMFFYLCIWLSIFVARKHYLALTSILLISAYLGFGWNTASPVATSFFHSQLFFEFIFGMLSFEIYRRNLMKTLHSHVMLFLGISSYVVMATTETLNPDIDRVMYFGLPSVLLVLSLTNLEDLIRRKDGSVTKALTTIGDGSYATYLSHFFVVVPFHKFDIFNPYTPIGVSIIVLLCLAVGHLLYKVLDNPLHKYFKHKFLALRPSQQRTGT